MVKLWEMVRCRSSFLERGKSCTHEPQGQCLKTLLTASLLAKTSAQSDAVAKAICMTKGWYIIAKYRRQHAIPEVKVVSLEFWSEKWLQEHIPSISSSQVTASRHLLSATLGS